MINEQIRDKEVRLVGEDGSQLGILPLREAQRLADEKRLDLVKIAPNAKPPVCKIIDYSKYKFELDKKQKEARKKQKTVDVKGIWLSPNIDTHDIQVKFKRAAEFLKDGDKLKVSVRFRYGREMSRQDSARTMLQKFAADLSEYGVVEKDAKMEARSLVMFMAPIKEKPEKPEKTENTEKPSK
ncbi:MAG: translation initiation factor IF-3 [Clostridiales bacterium]|jgi:translation initiation factor IF-3|nr:translation initiation factor IF-3 [Clostridiales bacterium]